MERRWSLLSVVISAACFGTLAILTPLAYKQGADPLPLLAWRFAFAAVLLGVLASRRDRRALLVPRADLSRYAVLALTGYGAASVCFFFALTYADASVVAVLLYAYPALVTISGWLFLGHRATWQQASAVAITFVGCALVVGIGSSEIYAAWQGVALGLGAAVGYTLFNLLSHRWLPGRSQLTMMA
ncbi:MAG TPA: DMT family transporter, partial [Coriobacteriia bacterium]|nr:DMT family transporter [Coriobacteriia bacterium]